MKKILILFSCMIIIQCKSYAQARINNTEIKNTRPGQPAVVPQNTTTTPGTTTLYYSVDPTAFTCGWGMYEIQKISEQGAYINITTTLSTAAPYLVAPVNLPHNARVSNITVVFYDVSATSNLQAIFWRSGTDFNYNLAQIESNNSGGYMTQSLAINTTIDNQNYSYNVSVAPLSGSQWPGSNGSLRIKRITIAYTLP